MYRIFKRIKGVRSPGQGFLEFALALPIFLLLVMGVFEFGRLLAVSSSVYTAAREGARYGSATNNEGTSGSTSYNYDCDGIRAAAKRVGFFAGLNDTNIQIGYDQTTADTVDINTLPQCEDHPAVHLGDRIVVNVSTTFHFLFLGIAAFPISSQSARTLLTEVDVDSTQGPTFTPRPTNSPTPGPTNTSTPEPNKPPTHTPRPTRTLAPTVTGTPPTVTATSTPTPTPTNTPTLAPSNTPIPVCGFLEAGAASNNSVAHTYSFGITNYSNGSDPEGISYPYPLRSVISNIAITWSPKVVPSPTPTATEHCVCGPTITPQPSPTPSHALVRIDFGGSTIWSGFISGFSAVPSPLVGIRELPPVNSMYPGSNVKPLTIYFADPQGAVSVDVTFDMGCHVYSSLDRSSP